MFIVGERGTREDPLVTSGVYVSSSPIKNKTKDELGERNVNTLVLVNERIDMT